MSSISEIICDAFWIEEAFMNILRQNGLRVFLQNLTQYRDQSREWVDGSWVMGQMGHENRMGHMGHGSQDVDP